MRLLAMIAATVAVAGCATQPADAASETPSSVAPGDENCDVTVAFGSYAMGIDSETYQKVEAYLDGRSDAQATMTRWGREGERTLCIDVTPDSRAGRVFEDIEAMAPPTANRGPITIRSRTGQSFQSKPPATMR